MVQPSPQTILELSPLQMPTTFLGLWFLHPQSQQISFFFLSFSFSFSLSHLSHLWSFSPKNFCNYIGPTWIIHDKLLKILNLITLVRHSQVSGIQTNMCVFGGVSFCVTYSVQCSESTPVKKG